MTKNDLREMFASDKDLIEKWHIRSGEGLDNCVDDTWNVIGNLELHKTDYGYFGIDRDYIVSMVGFFIKPEMRNSETLKRFWNDVKAQGDGYIFTGVYKKNIPAVDFLNRAGLVVKQNDTEIIFLIKGK